MSELTFYFGAASGSSRLALQKLEEPNVMINYATLKNEPWDGIQRLFIDSGGYSFMAGSESGEYHTSNEEYLDHIEEHDPDLFALRDYPCEPDLLEKHGRTVREHQRMTTDRHEDLLNQLNGRDIEAEPVVVLQGWRLVEYRKHLQDYFERGILGVSDSPTYVAIGSVCRRGQDEKIRRIVTYIRRDLPEEYDLHAFGVKQNVLRYPDVRAALTSADSMSYEFRAHHVDDGPVPPSKTWHDSAYSYLKQKRQIRALLAGRKDSDQRTLAETVTDGGFTEVADPGSGGDE